MSKIKGIFRYEFKNLMRSKIIWAILLLFVFGLQQIYSMGIKSFSLESGRFPGGAQPYVVQSWILINFIMFPIMIMSFNAAKSRNEIFGTTNLRPYESLNGKFMAVFAVTGGFFLLNILIPVVLAISEGADLGFIAYLMKAFILINIISFLALIALGFLIGQVMQRYLGDVVSFLFIIAAFLLICNFYRNNMAPNILYFTTMVGSSFNYFNYDSSFYYHLLFWAAVVVLCALIVYLVEYKQAYNKFMKAILIGIFPVLFIIGMSFYQEITSAPVKYVNFMKQEIDEFAAQGINIRAANSQYSGGIHSGRPFYYTYYSKDDCGYYVTSYDMDVVNKGSIWNKCTMEVSVTKDGLTEMEFGLFGKLKIKKLMVDGKSAAYTRDDNRFEVKLPQKKNKDDEVKIYVEYEGTINTINEQGIRMFFVNNSAAYLADTFEWYPKLNDKHEKNYIIKIHEGKNKVYSNLDVNSSGEQVVLKGTDSEIFIVYGELKEKSYKGYTFVGNDEDFLTEAQCDKAIDTVKHYQEEMKGKNGNGNNVSDNEENSTHETECKRIIYGSFILNGNRSIYKDTYLTHKLSF